MATEEDEYAEYLRLKKKFENREERHVPQTPACIYRGEEHDLWYDTVDGRTFLVCNICKMEKCPKCQTGVLQIAMGTDFDMHGCNRCNYGFATEVK